METFYVGMQYAKLMNDIYLKMKIADALL